MAVIKELLKNGRKSFVDIANELNVTETAVRKRVKKMEEEGIIIRMMDKLSRVKSFLDTGILNVTDESIDDTMVDIVNYTALLRGMIDERKEVSNVE